MKKGSIGVQTENIFPIIKKFLYSDHDIFLRELIANSTDACKKLETLKSKGKIDFELNPFQIEIEIKDKTLIFRDNGIGMTEEEVEKYINQIAFSGAKEFMSKYDQTKKDSGIIGNFGLGFYSSFMVAEKVEINTKSYLPDSVAVHWECDGSSNYTINKSDKKDYGTEIILHIFDENKDLLEKSKIENLLEKYCKFLPIPIKFGEIEEEIENEEKKKVKVKKDNIINNPNPIWKKNPQDLKDDDYKNFYNELFPLNYEGSVFNIHLNIDYPFNLTGVLYFPKLNNLLDVKNDKIQLFSNQMFVTNSVKDIVPDFLMHLHGVIDSPDIPLNVSRSYLQNDSNVKKISSYIVKKVAEKLEQTFNNNREDFEKKWDDIKFFVSFGMITNEKFYEKAEKFFLFKNIDNKFFSWEEYSNKIKDLQTNKDKKIVVLYSNNPDIQASYIDSAKELGYDVLHFPHPIDVHLISKLESKLENVQIVRIDSDVITKLIQKDDNQISKLNDTDKENIKKTFEKVVTDKAFTIVFESLGEKDLPILIVQNEAMRRMKEMSETSGGGGIYGNFPNMYNLVLNTNHPVYTKMLNETDETVKENKAEYLKNLALISQNLLKGDDLKKFINSTVNLI